MGFNPQALLDHRFEAIRASYTARDAILYALGVGLGADPLDPFDLDFLLEERGKVLPSFAVTLASPGMWIRDPIFGVTFSRLVHSEQDAIFHAPLPAAASIESVARIASLTDRGQDRGALLVIEREIRDSATGEPYCSIRQTLLLRGDGGFGGKPAVRAPTAPIPDRAPDWQLPCPTSRRAALIYRLSGDWNPLHADPQAARIAGFDRPILHGLASYGIAGVILMRATGRPLARLSCRFAGVVMPGDALDFAIWKTDATVQFEASVGGRRVLDQGFAELRDA